MKRVRIASYFALLALILCFGSARAQTPVKISPSAFPLLGFSFGLPDTGKYLDSAYDRLRQHGINVLYDGSSIMLHPSWGYGGQALTWFPEAVDDDAHLTPARTYFGNQRGDNSADGTEGRFFVAANEGQLYRAWDGSDSITNPEYAWDLKHNWTSKAGRTTPNKEWQFDPVIDSAPATDYILSGLAGPLPVYPLRSDQYLHCSFIYRFNGSLSGVADSTKLFQVEYTVSYEDGTHVYDTVQFSYEDYANFISVSHPLEHPHILTFPNPKWGGRFQAVTPYPYGVLYSDLPSQHGGAVATALECKLKRLVSSAGIFIRGLRIRSDFAQKILTNDSATIAEFKRICRVRKDSLVAMGQWNNVLALSAGSETKAINWRTEAHLDQICYKTIGRHIIPFTANNTPSEALWSWYRSIYEDETDSVPPPLSAENLEFESGADGVHSGLHFAPLPADAVDNILLEQPDRPKEFMPITGDTVREPLDATHFDTTAETVPLYHQRMQYHCDADSYLNGGLAACPTYAPADRFGSFYGHIALILSVVPNYNDVRSAVAPFDPLPAIAQQAFLNGHIHGLLTDTVIPYTAWDSTYGIAMDYRNMTSFEIRAQAWNALCYGAKGLVFNVYSSDGGGNIGPMLTVADSDRVDYDLTKSKSLISFQVGDSGHPLFPLSFWDEFRITCQTHTGGVWADTNISAWLAKDSLGNWPSYIALQMDTLEATGHSRDSALNGRIVDSFARVNCPLGTLYSPPGGVYGVTYRWVPWMAPAPATQFIHEWGAYRKSADHQDDWYNYAYWPYCWSSAANFWLPVWYGFRDKTAGTERVVNDVAPIAQTLHDLVWKDGIGYHHRFTRDSTGLHLTSINDKWSLFPIREDSGAGAVPLSRTFSPYTYPFALSGNSDTPDSSYFEIGHFTLPSDSLARYVAIANRRTWPVKYKYGTIQQWDSSDAAHPRQLLGAIDARRFSFKVRTSLWDTTWKYFNVTDLRASKEWLVAKDSLLTIDFEPGEGTLIRIAPALGFSAGRTDDAGMAYNNGHRLAEIDSIHKIMTWVRMGRLQYAVVNAPQILSEANFVTPDSAKIDAHSTISTPRNLLHSENGCPNDENSLHTLSEPRLIDEWKGR